MSTTVDDSILECLVGAGTDIVLSLPCNLLGSLLRMLEDSPLMHIAVCREEEGVGIAAGAALAGRLPVLLMQNSGFGNCVNALESLSRLYRLPLFLMMSHRGDAGEPVAAQVPMGTAVPRLLDALRIPWRSVQTPGDLSTLQRFITEGYAAGEVRAALLSRGLWQ